MRALAILALTSAGMVTACGSDLPPAPVSLGAPPAAYGQPAAASVYSSPAHSQRPYYQPATYRPALSNSEIEMGAPAPLFQTGSEGTAGSAPSAREEALPGQVTVLAGDTVYAISRRTGASPRAIIALNRLDPPYTLHVGETIRVPGNAVPPSGAERIKATNASAAITPEGLHVVGPGDTLYSISRNTGVSVDAIARANRLRPPFGLQVGQTLRIPGGVAGPARIEQPRHREAVVEIPKENVAEIARNVNYAAPAKPAPVSMFDWPIKGNIISAFGLTQSGRRNDGVNIAAPVGTPVRAAADGDVVYRGSELQGYGNLLLIKHEDGYVTAYAHNDVMLVKKGDRVRKGQVIAKVGQSGAASEPQLHFEVRQNLKAIDPVLLLGSL